ncbi:peptidoglycan-associated lipoprotein Pal [Geopsychrobacter electrodiphilus]|uniref:peptidoglycan-associated lipoprotein Pal n=1 Tax=Geopsychrobacter electrodiphilus TaxID=225196 RepID=UPI00036FEC9F|nr:peptidoglycan-associated lipoprotein Pal [Geopsychrobacter electrodiphilus]
MQLKPVIKLTALLALVLMLAVGCAKKPKMDDSAQVDQTQMQQEQVAQVAEQPVTEQPVTEQSSSMAQDTTADAATSLERVHFDFDQYVLTADARASLKNNAAYLNAKGVSVRIEGHCDERGSDEYNLALGEKRALAVKSYLVSLGVPAERMSILSYGEEMPLVMGHTEEAWAQNRRAEFKVLN